VELITDNGSASLRGLRKSTSQRCARGPIEEHHAAPFRTPVAVFALLEPLGELGSKRLLRERTQPASLRPSVVCLVKLGRPHSVRRTDDAALIKELRHEILIVSVLLGRVPHRLGRLEPVLLPGKASFDGPAEDAGRLSLQLVL
jgi:hypothetical protein